MRLLDVKESFGPYYTKKYIFVNDKHQTVEYTYIDRPPEHIICISCMYGCPVGCGFCKSGISFFGNLSLDDMKWILTFIAKDKDLFSNDQDMVFSFMGSGEPLLNYEAVAECINFLGKTFPHASFSLATSGVQIKNLMPFASQLQYYPKVQLSLHSPFDDERKKLIPNTSDLAEILDVLSVYQQQYNAKVMLNYIILDAINDSKKHVQGLVKLLQKYPFGLKINEYHNVGAGYSESKNFGMFLQLLHKAGISPKIYKTDGVEIGAACGQLFSEKVPNPSV